MNLGLGVHSWDMVSVPHPYGEYHPVSSNPTDWGSFFPELQRPCFGPLPTLTPPRGEKFAQSKGHSHPEAMPPFSFFLFF